MTDEEMVDAAYALLPEAGESKRWMTARFLSQRLRRRHPAHRAQLGQDRLFEILLAHYDHTPRENRLIRPSRLPSGKTLETLWGRVREGEVEEGESPILRGANEESVHAIGDRNENAKVQDPADEETLPDFFISYNQHDESEARRIAGILDRRGWSTWVAGERISPGGNINNLVREALGVARGFGLYLTENSVKSLWVGKELLFGTGNLTKYVILNAEDDELIKIFAAWRSGKRDAEFESAWRERLAHMKSLDSDFDSLLRELAVTEDRVFVHHPGNPSAVEGVTGLPPLAQFPRGGGDLEP
jgi:hypothetical protein